MVFSFLSWVAGSWFRVMSFGIFANHFPDLARVDGTEISLMVSLCPDKPFEKHFFRLMFLQMKRKLLVSLLIPGFRVNEILRGLGLRIRDGAPGVYESRQMSEIG